MVLRRAIAVASLALISMLGKVAAGPIEQGLAAAEHGEFKTAAGLFRTAADAGDPEGMFRLAGVLRSAAHRVRGTAPYDEKLIGINGLSSDKYMDEALHLYKVAAEKGHAASMRELADEYIEWPSKYKDSAKKARNG